MGIEGGATGLSARRRQGELSRYYDSQLVHAA